MSYCPRRPDPEAEQRERQARERWDARIQELSLLPSPQPQALTPNPTSQTPRPLFQKSCSWFKVLPNIRRDILQLAFGGTRLHMDLIYDYPDAPRQEFVAVLLLGNKSILGLLITLSRSNGIGGARDVTDFRQI
ncbi:hypothetical protein ACHAPJ_005159 [Fusarium lateritium]